MTTTYVIDGGQTLLASAEELTTAYLYGLGVIGEQTDVWAYTLLDGSNTPRQIVNDTGAVTLTASYTPWGDTLDVHGTGASHMGISAGLWMRLPGCCTRVMGSITIRPIDRRNASG